MPIHHVVIGDGATAAEFAGTARLGPSDRMTLIGPQVGAIGRGLAYADHADDRPWRYAYLLNSPATAVDAGFAAWLAENWRYVEAQMQGRRPDWLGFGRDYIAAGDYAALFAPRAIYGDFLCERAEAMLMAQSERGVTVERRAAPALDVSRQGPRFRITLAGSEAVLADRVDVATGGPAVQRFGSDAGPTAFSALYGNEDEIAGLMRHGREIVCLGANASMLDVLRLAQSVLVDADIRLTAISASGLLPEPLIWTRPRKPAVAPGIAGPFEKADAFLTALDRSIAEFRTKGATMAELRPGFKAWINDVGLDTLLPPLTERRKLGDSIERRFRRGTHDSIADFHRLRAKGQAQVIRGRVDRVDGREAGAVVVAVETPDGAKTFTAELVINCTGAGQLRAFDVLTTGLIRSGWLRFNKETGGIVVGKGLEGEVEGLRYLSPAVTEVGARVMPLPLYDMAGLRGLVRQANQAT